MSTRDQDNIENSQSSELIQNNDNQWMSGSKEAIPKSSPKMSTTPRESSDSTSSQSSEKLDSKFEVKEHQWQLESFHSPTVCEACGGLLWGLSKQGLKCKVCKIVCHQEHKSVVPLCGHIDSEQSDQDFIGSHEFYTKNFNRFTYCNVCRNLLVGLSSQGKCCETCRLVIHNGCASEAAKLPCLNFAQFNDKNQGCENTKHFWREGNLTQSLTGAETCIVCKKSCGSTQGLVDYFCVWCSLPCHTKCLAKAPEFCSLGKFKNMLIPPSAVAQFKDMKTDTMDYTVQAEGLCKDTYYPVVIFINKRSGGQQGGYLIRKFKRHLNPVQVFNMGKGGPKPGLEFMNKLDIPWKAVVCGGDGTVNWVLETIRNMNLKHRPPVAVIPLGTGNDLSRALGWGPGYEGESIPDILSQIAVAQETKLDRWNMEICKKEGNEYGPWKQENVMNNYFSIGIDARIALDFHHKRESDPNLFKSRTGNKLWYGIFGATAMFNGCSGLHKWIKLELDGKEVILDKEMEGIIILNVQSYGGGVNMWGKDDEKSTYAPQSYSDQLLEIVWVKGSSHLGSIRSGLSSARRLGQGKQIVISLVHDAALPVQIDGEPWMQDTNVKIRLSHLEAAPMLVPVSNKNK